MASLPAALERKSRNKLSWGYTTGYYVITPSKFLHEFKDDDNLRRDPVPELSIFLPDAVIGAPHGEKFNVKGKDRSGAMGKFAGTSELAFKAHSAAEAEKWFDVIRKVAGATGPPVPSPASEIMNPVDVTEKPRPVVAIPAEGEKAQAQETGVMGGETVASPVAAGSGVGGSMDKKGSGDSAGVGAAAAAAPVGEKAADVKV